MENRNHRHIFISCLVLLVATFGLNACNRGEKVQAAREDRNIMLSPAEQDFTMKVTQAHLSEIDMGRLAQQESQNSDVKDLAGMIVGDHQKGLERLTDLMNDKHVPQAKSLSPEIKQDITRMNGLSGDEFDREFINMMVSDHQKAVDLFRQQASTAMDADVKDYVNDLLPQLEKHLQKSQELQSKLFSGKATR